MGPALRLLWRDNNGKEGRQQFWLPPNLSIPAYVARANNLRNASVPLSSAQIIGAELLFEGVVTGLATPAALTSDVKRALVLFFRDSNGINSWRLPSPGQLPYDTAGEWRGIRITPAALAAAGLLDLVQAGAAQTVTRWQTPFPSTLTVAGLDIVTP